VPADVANAGVSPGKGGGLGATGSAGAADAGGAAGPDVGMISGSSFIALPFSSPTEASGGLPS
jgi:hypothetical protein